jgi:hypothetical protein
VQFGGGTLVPQRPRAHTGLVRISSLAAWLCAAASIGLVGASLVLDQVAARAGVAGTGSWWLYPFLAASVAAPALVGAMLLARGGADRIGWILVLGGLSVAVPLFSQPYAHVALVAHRGSLPAGAWAGLVADSAWPLFFAWPLALAYLFPDGRLSGRRWRPFAVLAVVSIPLMALLVAGMEEHLTSQFGAVASPLPFTLPGPESIRLPVWLSMFASVIAGALSLRARYRRSTGSERLQIRWLVWAALLVPAGFAACLVWGGITGRGESLVLADLLGAQAAAAVAVGVAVSRHRLYEIDRLTNRTLVYAALTALLGLFFGVVSIAAGVVAGRGSAWAAATATLAVAALFRPVRTRVQAQVDRRFDRARFDGLARVRAFELAVRDGHARAEDVSETLALALGDARAELLFWLPESATYADATGARKDPRDDGRVRTDAMRRGTRLALLLHDPALCEHRDLLESVIAAAGLTIEIARLRVEVKTQLSEVEASRERIVAAGYHERRRLERDLHDGAQQRLVHGAARPFPARPQAARPAPRHRRPGTRPVDLDSDPNPACNMRWASSRSLLDDTLPTEEALFHCSPKRRVRRRSRGVAASSRDAGSGRCSRSGSAGGSPGARARPPRRGRPR